MEIDLKETMEMEDQETGYGELHLHLDGAITPRIAKKLAALQGIELPYEGEQLNNALSVGEDFCRQRKVLVRRYIWYRKS